MSSAGCCVAKMREVTAQAAARLRRESMSHEVAISAWHCFMVADYLAYDEGMEFLGKIRIELCRRRQLSQPDDLLRLPCRICRRQMMLRL